MVLVSRMEAYQQDRCGLLMKPEPLDNSMGFRSWTDLPRGFEDSREREYVGAAYGGNNKDGLQWFDMRGDVPSFSLPVPDIVNQNSEDLSGMQSTGSPGVSHSSGISYDCNFNGNNALDSSVETDPPLSSYLLDGNVRAMLKKVTVNEEALNQTIQSLGGGEKGLKQLMGYIMLWVKEHKGEKGGNLFPSQNLKSLQRPPPPHQLVDPSSFGSYAFNFNPHGHHDRVNRTFETVQSSDEALDVNQLYQRAKSRRLMDDGEVDSCGGRGTFVDVRGSIPDGFRFPKPEMTPSPVMISGMPRELDIQQPVPSCLQPSLSFASGYDGLTQTLTASSRAARRNRIARQRQQQSPTTRTASIGTTAVSSGCGLWSIPPPPTLDMRSAALLHPSTQLPGAGVPANSGRKAYNLDMLTFLLQKELRPSDVGNLGRIILPKKEAEMHLPSLALREGVSLQMEDFDSGYGWTIRYRFWPNNKSRMYLLENTGEFVKSHHLEEGDRLILYRNQQGNYVLRGKKKVHLESRGAQGLQDKKNAHSLARGFPEAPLKTNVEVLKERDFGLGFQEDGSAAVGLKVKAEPTVLVGDDDPFFKEDLMHNIDSSFGAGLIQPLERFPSLYLDFPLDEIMGGNEIDDRAVVVPKTEPAG